MIKAPINRNFPGSFTLSASVNAATIENNAVTPKNELEPHSEMTPLISMITGSLVSSQSCHNVDVDT